MQINPKLIEKSGAGVRNSAFTNGTCSYYRIGNIIILIIADLYGNTTEYDNIIFTGLPKPKTQPIFICRSYRTFSQCRMRVDRDGKVITHYSTVPASSSGQQFYGYCFYETID